MASTLPTLIPDQAAWIDHRLLNVHYNEYAFEAEAPATMEEWRERRDFTRSQVALAAGLDPMPTRTPLEPRIWDSFATEGIIISKVRFESMPGLICTGNLYRPELIGNPAPGILSPHGHAMAGRLQDNELGSAIRRAMMLARLGFVVFSYDMLGVVDNNEIVHCWPEEVRRQASLYGASPFGLQTWNSLRAVDFLCSLPEVDANRIGCTGESGGGSQTWTVSLLDERIKVIAPVCMLSSHFQGGCQCEEAPLLRINGLTSFDVLAACAPRPLILPSVTQDWTNLNLRYEIPALRKVYALFGEEKALKAFQLDAPHNYNLESRERVYPWFCHWLLNQSLREKIIEDSLEIPPLEKLAHHPLPENFGKVYPHQPVNGDLWQTREKLGLIGKHLCADALPAATSMKEPAQFQAARAELVGEIVNNDQNLKDVAVRVTRPQWRINGARAWGCVISRRNVGDVIPAVRLYPDQPREEAPAILLLSGKGKSAFFLGGALAPLLEAMVARGCPCLVPDLMGNGETTEMPDKSPRDEHHPHFFAFEPTLYSMRVQDILTCLQLMREDGYQRICLVAADEAVKPALCALALTLRLHAAVFDLENQSDAPSAWLERLDYQPDIYKVGGMKGLASLANADRLALFKPDDPFLEYVNAFAKAGGTPGTVLVGRESFQRLVEMAIRDA